MINTNFDKTLSILQKGMDANRLRSRIIGNNIANAETPNYKRSDVNFESSLQTALSHEGMDSKLLRASKSSPLHYDFAKPLQWSQVQPRVVLDYLSTVKNNGNNVDLEREVNESTKNSLTYSMMADMMRFQFNQINMVVK
jgi:flagellar basal-body rod protein FlgB